jgi:hypothetical protein
MKAKIILLLFGTLLGVVFLAVAVQFLLPVKKGAEFESLSDLRLAMLKSPSDKGALNAENPQSMHDVVNPHPDDKLIYDLKPNLDISFVNVPVKTNSCGIRGPERPIAKPNNTYRIALLGDSFAFGWGLKFEDTFGQVIENNLNRVFSGGPHFEVLNFGVPGYSTFQEVSLLKFKGLDFQPDAVVVFLHENDFDLPFYVRDIYNPGKLMSGFKLASIAENAISPDLAQHRLEIKGYDPNTALRELSDLSRQNGFTIFLAINPRKAWRKTLKKLKVLGERDNIELMDIGDDFEQLVTRHGYTDEQLTLHNDPHPTALRARIYGDLMTPYLMDVQTGR